MAGSWQQHQVWDGTYTLDDLLDWHEIAAVKEENRRRAQDAAEARKGAG